MSHMALQSEFDHQSQTLLDKGYPELAGIAPLVFMQHLEPLRERLPEIDAPDDGLIPFLIVITQQLVSAEAAMEKVQLKGAAGSVNMYPVAPKDFKAVEGLSIPGGTAYLLTDIDTGQATLNVTPSAALPTIMGAARSPLTIDEGIALVTQFPEVLHDKQRYNCFSMLGSRGRDKRVPAMWISYGKPRLGWCWDGNPHTWLGSASCKARVGIIHQPVQM